MKAADTNRYYIKRLPLYLVGWLFSWVFLILLDQKNKTLSTTFDILFNPSICWRTPRGVRSPGLDLLANTFLALQDILNGPAKFFQSSHIKF